MMLSRFALSGAALLAFGVATTAYAEPSPFSAVPVSTFELQQARGGYELTLGGVQRMVREQLEAYDRQTGQIATVTIDNWSFDVGLPLIAANIGR